MLDYKRQTLLQFYSPNTFMSKFFDGEAGKKFIRQYGDDVEVDCITELEYRRIAHAATIITDWQPSLKHGDDDRYLNGLNCAWAKVASYLYKNEDWWREEVNPILEPEEVNAIVSMLSKGGDGYSNFRT